MTLPSIKRATFAVMAMTLSFGVMLALLLAADLYAHHRVERSAGVNRHGYRGPVVGRKPAATIRVAMLGGSTVFGFNLAVEETLPALLDARLARLAPGTQVVNLGYHAEGTITFVPTLRTYEYLDYDVVVLYEGYNDLLGDAEPNRLQRRHGSPVFRALGYYPILPQALSEKAGFLRQPSGDDRPVFRPGVGAAAALEATSAITLALGRQLDRVIDPVDVAAGTGKLCASPWSFYCDNVHAAVQVALSRGASVLVVGQPRLPHAPATRHAWQQRALAEMLAREFASEPRVSYLDLGGAADLSRTEITYDGMHLNPAANATVASQLAGPLAEVVRRHRQRLEAGRP